jgi:thymidylate synthase (FAD)
MITETVAGIEYQKPKVILLNQSGIGSAEIAARTCYDSFSNSENTWVKDFPDLVNDIYDNPPGHQSVLDNINQTKDSELLDSLAWTYHHHSIMEHASLTYYIEGTSRGVLQEHSRHRLQAISVRSTRYTMSDILYAFIASQRDSDSKSWFIQKITKFNMFVVTGQEQMLEASHMYEKLLHQQVKLGSQEFLRTCLSKTNLENYNINKSNSALDIFKSLQQGKKKRNVGDSFKWVVTDNFKVDLVVTFNLRSLKNYYELRASGSSYFQIQWLAEEMIKATPRKYLDLIIKKDKIDKILGI